MRITLFLVTVTALFLAHEPLARLAKLSVSGSVTTTRVAFWLGWLVVYLLVTVAATAWLLFYYQLWHLLSLGAASVVLLVAHLLLTAARAERRMIGEFLGICGLTLTAPGTYYVLLGRLDSFAFLLWFLNLLDFTSGILYVKMRVARFTRKPEAVALSRQCAFYHLLLLALVITLIWSKQLSLWILLAFLPAAIRAFRGMGVRQPSLNMRRVGYTEVALTVVFVILLVWGLKSSPG